MSDTRPPNIHKRIHAVMQSLAYIQKGERRVNNQYRFVSHDQVIGALRPLLVDNGIVMLPTVTAHTQSGNTTEVDIQVTFVNIDEPSDNVSVGCFGYGIDPSDKGPGKAVSYAIKYALLKTFCLETGDDPDNDQHTKRETAAPKPRAEDNGTQGAQSKQPVSHDPETGELSLDGMWARVGELYGRLGKNKKTIWSDISNVIGQAVSNKADVDEFALACYVAHLENLAMATAP